MVTREEKETAELIQKIAKKFNFISSEKLIENILEKERKEKEIPNKIIDNEEENNQIRKLGFNFNIDKIFNIKTISFLGQTITIKYRVAVQNGRAINQLKINSNLGTAKFGNDGIDIETSKTWQGNKKIFQFNFPPIPPVYLAVYAGGSLGYSIKI